MGVIFLDFTNFYFLWLVSLIVVWYIDMVLLARQPGTRLMQTDVLNTQRIHLATMNIVLFFICVFVFVFF